LHSKEQI